jgi:hypothetical protein
MPSANKERDWNYSASSQEPAEICENHQMYPYWSLDIRLLASRTVRQQISVVVSHSVYDTSLQKS